MATYDIWVHTRGRDGVCIDTVSGSKKREGKKAMQDAARIHFPNLETKWDSETALLVRRDGDVLATIALEIPEVREHRERKVKR